MVDARNVLVGVLPLGRILPLFRDQMADHYSRINAER